MAGVLASAVTSMGLAALGFLPTQRADAAAPLGIDVSSWQGSSVNWSAVAGAGVSFAYIRAGEGTGLVDSEFRANWYRSTGAGLIPGAYLFFHPSEDPVAQARLLLTQLHGVDFTHGDLLPAIDVEVTDGQPASTIVANLQTLVNAVAASINAYPVIYTAPAWWDGHVGSTAFAADPLWVANWGVTTPSVPAFNWGGAGWQVWQYSNAGSVAGIPGSVDMDTGGSGSLPYYGSAGLMPQQAPVSLAVSNVAGMPQTVSEGTGNIDVLWRGTDGRLWTIGYRNSRWAGQATAISPANLATDPTVVSSDPGKADAYWEGIDGNLWHVAYQAGWYGSGAWGTAASLGMGPMQSAPHATAGGGSIDVAWRGAGGSLEVLHAGVAPGATGAVGGVAFGGDPYPVAVGNGQTDVFWRDPGGNLWMEQRMSWGSGSAQELGDGPLGSDPVPVSAGDGNVDVFWHGTDGGLWHVAVASGVGGAPQRVASQGMVGRPTALEETAGAITLVLRRTDGNLATLLQLPGVGWVGPELLGDGPVGSDPSSVSYASGATNVFWRGQNGGLWTSAACPGCSLPPPPPVTTLP